MKINELRIGNLVIIGKDWQVKIEWIDKDGFVHYDGGATHISQVRPVGKPTKKSK